MRIIFGIIYTLRLYERSIQEIQDKYNQFVMPGLGFQIPMIHIFRVSDIREHTIETHPQVVITKDPVEIMIKNPKRECSKINTSEYGISPTLVLGILPVNMSRKKGSVL